MLVYNEPPDGRDLILTPQQFSTINTPQFLHAFTSSLAAMFATEQSPRDAQRTPAPALG